jgi:carboxyl-terminal processing protease
MARKSLPALHPAGVMVGAVLTGIGVFLAETVVGPLLDRSMTPQEERVMGLVHRNLVESYVEPRDPQWLLHRAVEGMLDSLDDPYTYFIDPKAIPALDEESTGNLIGIGILLDGNGRVRYPVPGSPAEAAGIRPGDRFLAIDGEDALGLTMEELTKRIKGPRGTSLHLVVETAAGEPFETDIERSPVPKGTVGKVRMLDPENGIGTLAIRSFARSTPDELDAALDHLDAQGLRGLVIDLRFNTGGVLDAAVDVAARFLEGEVVCRLQERGGPGSVRRADAALSRFPELPLVVLVNALSASGSEVLAGALRDHGHAVLVGERSYGKGVYQQVHRYRTADFALKYTAGYYLTPSGRILEGHIDPARAGGLEPDLGVAVGLPEARAVRDWLRYEDPPLEYRERVFELFPRVAEVQPPEDAALATGERHLRQVLGSAS